MLLDVTVRNIRKRPSQLPRGTSGLLFDRISRSSFKYDQDVARNLMFLDLPLKQTIYNDLYHPVHLLPKWDLRTLASSLMEDSFWESTFFLNFQAYRKRTSDLACWLVLFH